MHEACAQAIERALASGDEVCQEEMSAVVGTVDVSAAITEEKAHPRRFLKILFGREHGRECPS